MKENSDIDGGGKGDINRSTSRSQGSGSTCKRLPGNRTRVRRDQKETRLDVATEAHNPTSNSVSSNSSPTVKVLPQATAEQIRIAQLLSNGEEERALKEKVNQVVELTGCDQDTAALSLHDCDGDVSLTVHMILDARVNTTESNGLDDLKQDEWQTTSKRHPKKSIGTSEVPNGQNHDVSLVERGDEWDLKSKETRDRRSIRRGTSERRGGSRPKLSSGVNENEEGERRNRSERRGRGSARGRSERGGRQRHNDSISPGVGKDDSHFLNGSSDNDFGSFQNDSHGISSRDRGVPPRFDVRRGARGNFRGGGRIFSSRGGRGGRGRPRLSYGQFRDKSQSGAGDDNLSNWTSDHNQHGPKLPQNDEGWDDLNDWDSVWRGETQVFTNSKVVQESDDTQKHDECLSIPDDKNDPFTVTTVEDDDPAIVNSVSSAQLNEAAIAAFNHRATEVIKTSLGIGPATLSTSEEPKPQRLPRTNDRNETSSPNLSSRDKTSLRAALEEEILGGVGPKHARSKAPPPSKRPDKPVELPRMRGLPSDQSSTGLCFGFGFLDDLKNSPIKSNEECVNVETSLSAASQSLLNSESDIMNSSSETNPHPETSIQEYLSSPMNSSFQQSDRQPTPVTNSVSPVKPPSLSTTPNQYHSPLKVVDSDDVTVASNDPFQSQTAGIPSDLAAELVNKLSTRPDNQSSQTQTQENHPEIQPLRQEAPSVPSVMDKATQPTPSSSQQNTPNKATGVSRSQQTSAPQNAGNQNILGTLPSAAMNALLNYSHLATQGHHSFPYINIPTMPQHGTIDYEQIVQQQQRIIYDLALQQHQPQPQQNTTQTPPSQQTQQHHSQHQNQNVHQHDTVCSMSTSGTSGTTVVNASGSSSASGSGLKPISNSLRNSSVNDVPVQSPTAAALPGSALPHLQAVTSSVVPTSGVATTATHHNMFMPPGYAPYYPNYYAAAATNPAAAAAAAAQAAAPPGHHPSGAGQAYNTATFLSIMNSINQQQPVSQALSSPPHFGTSMGVSKGQSNNVFPSYGDRGYGGSSTSSAFDDHMSDMKYSGLNTGKDIGSAYGNSGSSKPTNLGVGPSNAYHSGVTSGSGHRGNSSISESVAGARNSGSAGLDNSSKNVTGSGGGAVAPGAGASGFPFTLTGNPGIYNAGYVPFMTHPHHHHIAAQNQQERQGTNSGVPQGAAAGSLPGGPQFGTKGNNSVFSKQATAILHQNYHASGTSATYWNSLK